MRRLILLLSIGLLASGFARAADLLDAEAMAGKKVYTGKCGRCHKLQDPNKYSDSQWDDWMAKMSKKAKLTEEQSKQLTVFIKTLRLDKH